MLLSLKWPLTNMFYHQIFTEVILQFEFRFFRYDCRPRKLKTAKINAHVFLVRIAKIWWRENIPVQGIQPGYVRVCIVWLFLNMYSRAIWRSGYTTLRRTTLRLLNHFVEKAFCRIVILSNFHFVETVFRRILSTKYFMHPPAPYYICRSFGLWGYGHWRRLPIWSWLLFLWGCSWGNERVKQWFIENNWYGHIL